MTRTASDRIIESAQEETQTVDPQTDARPLPDDFFKKMVHVPDAALDSLKSQIVAVTADQVRKAHELGLLKHMQLLMEDTKFLTTTDAAFEAVLPYVGTNQMRYVASRWVCRTYANLFTVVCAGLLDIDAVGRTLDFAGHHSYNAVWLMQDGVLTEFAIEPQTDQLIRTLDSARHYTGEGLVTCGA